MSQFPAFVVWRLSLTRGATATTKRSAASLLEELSVYITWDFAEKPALAGLQTEGSRLRFPEASQTPQGATSSALQVSLIERRFFQQNLCLEGPLL
jgi:hypothetical protein